MALTIYKVYSTTLDFQTKRDFLTEEKAKHPEWKVRARDYQVEIQK